ncbi:unnamed protein product, partial [Symbiodinium microadriaticum]
MPGPTLLEEASRLCDCPAFYLAATLLETLEEHFWGPSSCQEARQCQSVPPANPAVTAGKTANRIDLIAAIPPTAYQRSVEELQRLVPPPSCLHSDPDWLDTDLSHLLTCKAVPDKWKCKFANFVSWHTHAQSALHRLEIFTDGSADGAQTAVPSGAPCAWAFSVWAVTADGRFLVGWAAHAAVPPDTPFSLGEIDDSAITSELLALGWAIIWTLEFGSRYPVPIVFCYDSTAAGHGIFGINFSFSAVSYNVLTMFDPSAAKGRASRNKQVGLMIQGKRDLIKQQLTKQGIWLAGFQETRLPESGQLPDGDFYMLNSAATESGSYGCALWIDLSKPFAFAQGAPCRASKENIVVTSYSPRHIQVQIDTPWIRLTVLVAHGPSVLRHEDQATEFWRQRQADLATRPEGSETILLVDANGRLGSIPTTAVGECAPEQENDAGAIFHCFLLELGCILPSTFPAWHVGQSWTWTAPGSDGVRHRIDYIGVPDTWADFHFSSWVWLAFESLQTRLDHYPVVLEMTFWRNLPGMRYTQAKRIAHRPTRDLETVQRSSFVQHLSAQPPATWEVGPDIHFAKFVDVLHAASDNLTASTPAAPKQPYLSPETLDLVQQRAALRRYLRDEDKERQRRLLLISFAAFLHMFRGSAFTAAAAAATASRWLADIDISVARAVSAIDYLTDCIRRAVRVDRTAYLQGLVQNLSLKEVLQPQRLFTAVRKAFPQAKSARRANLRPLPAIRGEDGNLVVDPAARNERWRAFFAEQEAGVIIPDGSYSAFFCQPDIQTHTSQITPSPSYEIFSGEKNRLTVTLFYTMPGLLRLYLLWLKPERLFLPGSSDLGQVILYLLHLHWHSQPKASWLHHVVLDLKAVAVYSPSAALVLQATCPVRAFIEALQTEPNWWKKQIHHAISGFAKDLCTWHHSKITATTTDEDPEPEPAQPVDLPFQCRWCSKTFALHKHVAVHEARRHGALSPARHYAYAP